MRSSPGSRHVPGIHEHDDRLADLSRAAKEADIAARRRFLSALEALDPTSALASGDRFERELAMHGARRACSMTRSCAAGSAAPPPATRSATLFLLFARDFAPLR